MKKKYTMEEFEKMFEEAVKEADKNLDKNIDDVVKSGKLSEAEGNKAKLSSMMQNFMFTMELRIQLFGDK